QPKFGFVLGHGSKAGYSPGVAGVDARRATPPDPILPAFTEAGRGRKPRPEPASIRPSSPATERASGSEKLRFCAFRATTPAFAEAGRGHKTIALKSLYKTHPNLYGSSVRWKMPEKSEFPVAPGSHPG